MPHQVSLQTVPLHWVAWFLKFRALAQMYMLHLSPLHSCCRYIRYTRWKPTSTAEAVAAEKNLLASTG